MALQALALTGGLGLTVQSAVTKVLAHYRRKVCEQAPAGKGISRPWARNFSFSTWLSEGERFGGCGL